VVVDSFSRKYEEGSLFSLSFLVSDWLKAFRWKWLQDPKFSSLIQQLKHDRNSSSGYSCHNEEIHYEGHLYLRKQSHLKSIVLFELHASPIAVNSSFHKTYERIKCSFFLGMHETRHPHFCG
jgi:hypothetical protein